MDIKRLHRHCSELQKICEEEGPKSTQIMEKPNTSCEEDCLVHSVPGFQVEMSCLGKGKPLKCSVTLSFCPRSMASVACPPYQPGNR